MRLILILLCVCLLGCGRPLTDAERVFMSEIQGSDFDASPVRIVENPLIGRITQSYPARPQVTCRERVMPPPQSDILEGSTAGMVLFNTLHVRDDVFLEDYTRTNDGRQNLYAAMFFAHEMTHVWQWQNRQITGYHPILAAGEHIRVEDPYLFDPHDTRQFLDYGYEQQASLVEEYVCCRAVDPDGARTARLERLIGQVMPVTPLQSRADATAPYVPWSGFNARGLCS